jgi:hypothetical protein
MDRKIVLSLPDNKNTRSKCSDNIFNKLLDIFVSISNNLLLVSADIKRESRCDREMNLNYYGTIMELLWNYIVMF